MGKFFDWLIDTIFSNTNSSSETTSGEYISEMEMTRINARRMGTDLVEAGNIGACCEKCAKYRKRVYSLSGRDKRFPMFPKDFCEECGIAIFPYTYGLDHPSFRCSDIIKYSNRPFVDDRTKKQLNDYQKLLDEGKENLEREKDREIYEKLLKVLPDKAPKSFSGYRRMKKSNSSSFLSLKEDAKKQGIFL